MSTGDGNGGDGRMGEEGKREKKKGDKGGGSEEEHGGNVLQFRMVSLSIWHFIIQLGMLNKTKELQIWGRGTNNGQIWGVLSSRKFLYNDLHFSFF